MPVLTIMPTPSMPTYDYLVFYTYSVCFAYLPKPIRSYNIVCYAYLVSFQFCLPIANLLNLLLQTIVSLLCPTMPT